MRKEYDFSKSKKNPYVRHLKRHVTLRLEHDTIAYFKRLAAEHGMPYQTLINLYLRECAQSLRKPSISWTPRKS